MPDSSCGEPVDADYVIQRLEEAGATLLALPGTGWSTRLRSSSIEIVRTAIEAVRLASQAGPPRGADRRADHQDG